MKNLFFNTIKNLREMEEFVLYGTVLKIEANEEISLIEFLKTEFEKECLDYPYNPPTFDPELALWAAKIVFISGQLVLARELSIKEIIALLPTFEGKITPSAILSADLCLRFLPSVMESLSFLDPEDMLISMLEKNLTLFHFSAIGYDLDISSLNFATILEDDCLTQLYINRVIEKKVLKLALVPELSSKIKACLGMYENEFWNEFGNIAENESNRKT